MNLLTPQQAADRLAVSQRTVMRLHARRVFAYVRIGWQVRFPEAALDQWIADQTRYPQQVDCAGQKPEDVKCIARKAARTGGSRTETPAGGRLREAIATALFPPQNALTGSQ